MAQPDGRDGVDLETMIAERLNALLARKREANARVLARIEALDTGWKEINTGIDADLKADLDVARVEAQVMKDAKARLARTVCNGVDPKSFGVAGKVVDAQSKVGLPGLTVKLEFNVEPAAESRQTTTDDYGDFFFSLPLGVEAARPHQIAALITVSLDEDTVVHGEATTLEPKLGAVKHLTVAVECSGKLNDVLEHGRQVAASVETDAQIVEARAVNSETAYAAFGGLADSALSMLRSLREDLSVEPPQELAQPPAPEPPPAEEPPTEEPPAKQPPREEPPVGKARYLGNSHSHELHDRKNVKKQCQINEIKRDYRVYYRTEREALKAGYDRCRYCFGKQKSRR